MRNDPEFSDILPALSLPAEAHDPGLSRRRFLQGVLATGAVAAALPALFPDRARGAAPLGDHDGVLVVLFLGGGNDGLNTVAPSSAPSRARYQALRSDLAIPAAALLDAGSGYGLHPSLARLHARYNRGQVALVQGAGQGNGSPLSHFDAVRSMMSASPSSNDGTGWLGRYLDGVSDSSSGMRGVSFGSGVPLHLVGQSSRTTAIPGSAVNRPTDARAVAVRDTIQAYANESTGLRDQGDDLAAVGRDAITQLGSISGIYAPAVNGEPVFRDLTLAARLINANLGTRVISVLQGGYDTHLGQAAAQGHLLAVLDAAIESFFASLSPAFANRVTLLAVSEFGRRPQRNGSFGTDHGTANLMLLAGANVRGGLHAQAPSLDSLDERGNLVPTVDFRSVYASVLERWMGGDARQVLGGRYEQLDLFRAGPGSA